MNRNRRSRTLLVFMLILSTLLYTACGQAPQGEHNHAAGVQTIKIGYLPITHAAPIFVSDVMTEGNQQFQLELVKFSAWPDLLDALNTGAIDGASVLIQLAMQAKAQGSDITALALGHRDGNVVVSGNDIESVDDLIGQNFAIPHRFSAHNMLLHVMLQQAGYEYDDVNVIELAPPEMPAALAEGRIAGYSVAEPFGAHSVALGTGKVLFQSNELWHDSLCCILVLRTDFINNQQELTQELVNEYVHAGNLAHSGEHDSHGIIRDYLGVDEEVLNLSLGWITYEDFKMYQEEYEVLRELFIEMELNDNPPTYEEFFDSSFIDQAQG